VTATRALRGAAATAAIARLTWRRLLRGRIVWASLALLALPVLPAIFDPDQQEGVVRVTCAMLAVLVPLHLASAIADEAEAKTFTYLWSRPVARWTLVTGKIVGLVPALAAAVAAAAGIALLVSSRGLTPEGTEMALRGAGALAVGATTASMMALGLGTIVPRFPLPAAIAYLLLVDLVIGEIPYSVSKLAVTRHIRVMAGVDASSEPAVITVAWCMALGAAWLAVAIWRVSRAEYATEK
jgi:hypothetical protein